MIILGDILSSGGRSTLCAKELMHKVLFVVRYVRNHIGECIGRCGCGIGSGYNSGITCEYGGARSCDVHAPVCVLYIHTSKHLLGATSSSPL